MTDEPVIFERDPRRRTVADLQCGDHVCTTFRSDGEHFDVLAEFVRSGAERNERILYFTDEQEPMETLEQLRVRRVDVASLVRETRLSVATAGQSYLMRGSFDPDTVIEQWVEGVWRTAVEGYSGLRVAADMGWILRGVPGSARIGEYERRSQSEVFGRYPITGLCAFDMRRFTHGWLPIIHELHPQGIVAP